VFNATLCRALISAICAAACWLPMEVTAETRVALVVGNSNYRNVTRLNNPRNDAVLMADTLRSLGFELIGGAPQIDLDKASFDRILQSFGGKLAGADVSLFYYAGHGVHVRDSNYLVPTDANPVREADVLFQMVDAAVVLRQMEGSGTKLNLVILDACRNNPFGERSLRSGARGLAQMQAPEGTLISYATQPGNVAIDGNDGHSPFTKALAATIRKPGLDIFQAFNEVGLLVKRSTGGAQRPWVSSSPIDGNFYFSGPAKTGVAPPPHTPAAGEAERAWNAIKDTQNVAVLENFVQHFGGSFYASLARVRIEELKTKKVAAVPPASQPGDSQPDVPPAMQGAKPTLLGRFNSWGAYAVSIGGKKQCFALTQYSPPGSAGRDKSYVFVSTRPWQNVINEFSVASSHQSKTPLRGMTADVGGASYGLLTRGDAAWIEKKEQESLLIARMQSNAELTLRSTGKMESSMRISLRGFSQALSRVADECR